VSSNAPPSVTFVTVSYGPDRDRCALLTESLAAFAPTYDHWIVVDRADLPRFRSLAGGRTTVTTTEEVLPVWIRRLNLRRIGLRSNPLARWLLRTKRTRYLMRSLYALRAGLMLKRTSLDESRSDYWQAGKSVAGIDAVEPAGEIVRRFRRAAE